MDVILIAAVSVDGYIARHSLETVTWSRDLKLFKEQTMGYPVIMGSNTYKTLAADLEGRPMIVMHRNDDPKEILSKLNSERCFVIGGGRTYTRFVPYLTHLYLTFHPLVLGRGIPIFPGLKQEINLSLRKKIIVSQEEGIFQFQYLVKQ